MKTQSHGLLCPSWCSCLTLEALKHQLPPLISDFAAQTQGSHFGTLMAVPAAASCRSPGASVFLEGTGQV